MFTLRQTETVYVAGGNINRVLNPVQSHLLIPSLAMAVLGRGFSRGEHYAGCMVLGAWKEGKW